MRDSRLRRGAALVATLTGLHELLLYTVVTTGH